MALTVLAERRRDLAMAEQALAQITMAFETFRDAHDARGATSEAPIALARILVERLREQAKKPASEPAGKAGSPARRMRPAGVGSRRS
jgi:hypothetical protein